MSTIADKYLNLPKIIDAYEDALALAEERVSVNDKGLVEANRENAVWQYHYETRCAELDAIVSYAKMRVSKARSKLYVSYTETHDRSLTETGKNSYIDGEPAYLKEKEVHITLIELRDRYSVACKAFTTRGYALNNLTKLAIAEINDPLY